jgi:hypothetical protein
MRCRGVAFVRFLRTHPTLRRRPFRHRAVGDRVLWRERDLGPRADKVVFNQLKDMRWALHGAQPGDSALTRVGRRLMRRSADRIDFVVEGFAKSGGPVCLSLLGTLMLNEKRLRCASGPSPFPTRPVLRTGYRSGWKSFCSKYQSPWTWRAKARS